MKEEKDVVLEEIKKYEEKVFTKKRANSKITKNNLSKIDCKIYERKNGLYMKNVVLNKAQKELSKRYDVKEKVIEVLFKKCKEANYNIEESQEIIVEFLEIRNLSKTCPLF